MSNIQSRSLIEVHELASELRDFAHVRDWGQFHSPKNLAMALTGEVGELVEIFQWMTEEDSRLALNDPKTAQALRHELADVVMYAVRLADVLAIDLDAAVKEKLALNGQKYPAELARGTSAKYNELPGGQETQ